MCFTFITISPCLEGKKVGVTGKKWRHRKKVGATAKKIHWRHGKKFIGVTASVTRNARSKITRNWSHWSQHTT
jgi:hypothetical protein